MADLQLISIQKRTRRPGRGYAAMPRIYFSHDAESLLQNLANRTSRPIQAYRSLIPAIRKLMGLPDDTRMRWSKHAGCRMCPCSPGFIMENARGLSRWDAMVTVSGAYIDAADPQAVARATARARQILRDPTLNPAKGVYL